MGYKRFHALLIAVSAHIRQRGHPHRCRENRHTFEKISAEALTMDFLTTTVVWQNSLLTWSSAALVAVLVFVGLRLTVRIARGKLTRVAARTAATWDDVLVAVVGRTRTLVLLVAALYVASLSLTLPDDMQRIVTGIVTLFLLVQAGIWVTAAMRGLLDRYIEMQQDDGATVTTVTALGFVAQVGVWVVVTLLALDNLGVDITVLVTGLGVGSIAVALAVQNVLGDLLASLSIVLDKPFVIGDFIIVGDLMGSVEHVGLKTTRVRSLSGEQLVFSNGDLLASRIRNYGRMEERRALFEFGVTYDTPRDKLQRIPEIVKEAIGREERARFDRSHFKNYGDSSLDFESVYYVLVPDYNEYMNVQQAINLRIHERFNEEGIQFAFPTRTVHLVGEAERREAG